MRYEQVTAVLDALDEAQVRSWVAGGWGIAVLVGRQTREHRDLDLFIDAQRLDRCLQVLDRLGYVIETDWLPTRIELAGAERAWVDVHPLEFDAEDRGRLILPDESVLEFPSDAFTTGTLNGRSIPCLAATMQRAVHTGYEPRPEDLHDLAQLDAVAWREPPSDGPPRRC